MKLEKIPNFGLPDFLEVRELWAQLAQRIPEIYRISVTAHDLYTLVQRILEDLIFLTSHKHFRKPKRNPEVIVKQGVIAADGVNTDDIQVRYDKTSLVDAEPVEVQSLLYIIEELKTLDRNRHPRRCMSQAMTCQRNREMVHEKPLTNPKAVKALIRHKQKRRKNKK